MLPSPYSIPLKNGRYHCPAKECREKFRSAPGLTSHMKARHGYVSNGKAKRNGALLPGQRIVKRMVNFCPNCGYDVGTAEDAAYLLTHQPKVKP